LDLNIGAIVLEL